MEVEKDRLWSHLTRLCVDIGPRLSGTQADERSVEYISRQFENSGAVVEIQDFPCPGWEQEGSELTLLDGEEKPVVPSFAQTFTEGCDLEAELAVVELRHDLEFRPDLEGKLLVVHGEAGENLALDRNVGLLAIEERRPAAVIVVSPVEEVSSKLIRDPFLRVPAVAVAPSIGETLKAKEGQRAKLTIRARRYDSKSHNVIGHLPGSGPGRIVIGSHYDTAADCPGAADNAGGTAAVMELCEVFSKIDPRPLGIDFIAFGAEEYGRHIRAIGSVEYIRRHRSETLETQAIIQADGPGLAKTLLPVHVMGWHPARAEALMRIVDRFPGCDADTRPEFGSDHVPFYINNIPAVFFGGDGSLIPLHSAADTIDLMGKEELLEATEAMAEVTKHLLGS